LTRALQLGQVAIQDPHLAPGKIRGYPG